MVGRALLIVAALAGSAGADSGDAALSWQAPDGCPGVAEVRARIERRLGASIEQAVHGIAVAIAREDGRFVARIDLRAITVENEVRVLSSARCDDLADAVAIVIARIAAERRPPVEVRAAAVRIELPPPLAEAPRERWGGGLRVQAISGIGALPRVGLAGELAAFLRRDAVYVELSAARWTPSEQFLRAGSPGRGDVRLDAVALRVGYQSQRLPLRGWIASELGEIQGVADRFDGAEMTASQWIALGAGFGVGWPMTRHVRLVGVLEAMVPLERTRFRQRDQVLGFRSDPLAVRSGIGLEAGW